MKKIMLCLFAVSAISGFAQAPPAMTPIQDAFWESLIGKWEGWSESSMGKSADEVEFEWELQKQFLKTKVEAKSGEMTYKMVGYSTIDATGKITGHWFDSWRLVYASTETRNGNKVTMRIEGGPGPVERTYEKVGEDKLVGTFKVTMNGQTFEGRSELTRKVKAAKK
ncbi:MAG: hypothetical protein AAB354_13755 [candidate division KSB1 bacterium]